MGESREGSADRCGSLPTIELATNFVGCREGEERRRGVGYKVKGRQNSPVSDKRKIYT